MSRQEVPFPISYNSWLIHLRVGQWLFRNGRKPTKFPVEGEAPSDKERLNQAGRCILHRALPKVYFLNYEVEEWRSCFHEYRREDRKQELQKCPLRLLLHGRLGLFLFIPYYFQHMIIVDRRQV